MTRAQLGERYLAQRRKEEEKQRRQARPTICNQQRPGQGIAVAKSIRSFSFFPLRLCVFARVSSSLSRAFASARDSHRLAPTLERGSERMTASFAALTVWRDDACSARRKISRAKTQRRKEEEKQRRQARPIICNQQRPGQGIAVAKLIHSFSFSPLRLCLCARFPSTGSHAGAWEREDDGIVRC
jgi:hypothetical protein